MMSRTHERVKSSLAFLPVLDCHVPANTTAQTKQREQKQNSNGSSSMPLPPLA
jgi:hypothetical protein